MEFKFDTFVLNTYDDIKPYLDDLVNREVKTTEETAQWIKDYDVLQGNISENLAWRYIRHTGDTNNEKYKEDYMFFVSQISPKLQEIDDPLNKKILTLPGIDELAQENEGYEIWVRGVRRALEMFREESIPLKTELSEKARMYGEIAGAMSIEHDGKTLTMKQGEQLLESPDREQRKIVFEKLWTRRAQDAEKLDDLLSDLITLRNKVAQQAGYESFVEYAWDALGRFDYSQSDVFSFHQGVKEHVVPLMSKIFEIKKQKLGIESVKPYDEEANVKGVEPLKPFKNTEELLEKTITCLERVSPDFGDNLRVMKAHNRFDLDARVGKAPGGYNYPLAITIYPFIFMNVAENHQGLITLLHEAGHAMHSFCIEQAGINMCLFSDYPIEMAEVASMSMELMTMDHLDLFYETADEVKRAKLDQLERTLEILPWVSIVDSFQYWLYKNPNHTAQERREKFASLLTEFKPWIDWTGYEDAQHIFWQKQLHIFEIPFYYIEYGIAQLGAIGVWKNYKQDKQNGLAMYKKGLGLGSTKKLPALYEAAGVPFNFSPARIKELADFVQEEMHKLASE